MKVVVFGNSGSGKSTAAKALRERFGLAYLDLDTIAWKPDQPGVRQSRALSDAALAAFCEAHAAWVIEGCYGELITEAAAQASLMLFLNPGVAACQANCRSRPWEPHKYPTQAAQDANLAMLLGWVAGYETRQDEFSLAAHHAIYDAFTGAKHEWQHNVDLDRELDAFGQEGKG